MTNQPNKTLNEDNEKYIKQLKIEFHDEKKERYKENIDTILKLIIGRNVKSIKKFEEKKIQEIENRFFPKKIEEAEQIEYPTEQESKEASSLFENIISAEYCLFLLTNYNKTLNNFVDIIELSEDYKKKINGEKIQLLIETSIIHNKVCETNILSKKENDKTKKENDKTNKESKKIYFMIYFLIKFLHRKYINERFKPPDEFDQNEYKINTDFDIIIYLIKNNNETINKIMSTYITDENIEKLDMPNMIDKLNVTIYDSIYKEWEQLKKWEEQNNVVGGKRRRKRSKKKKRASKKARRSKSRKSHRKYH